MPAEPVPGTGAPAPGENRLTVGSVVLGVGDIARATRFWTAALDYHPRDEGDGRWVVLAPRSGTGVQVALMRSDTDVQRYPRVHLDLYAEDQTAEIDRLLALGATETDWDRYPEDADFVVLADPDGNRFCVIDTTRG